MRVLNRSLGKIISMLQVVQLKFQKGQSSAVPGLDLKQVEAVHSVRPKHMMNKAGRLVFRGVERGEPVKLYQASTTDHARFILSVCQVPCMRSLFPVVRQTRGAFVVCHWAEGIPGASFAPGRLVDLLTRLHGCPLNGLPTCGFDYWYDFVLPRFSLAASFFGREDILQALQRDVSQFWDDQREFLSHPDLTRDNIVIGRDNRPLIIDNEFLGVGRLPLLDLCNALKSLDDTERDEAVRQWAGSRLCPGPEEVTVTALAWFARLLGSAFVAGRLDEGVKLIEQYEADPPGLLPFDPEILQKG